jgi:putative membrane protein
MKLIGWLLGVLYFLAVVVFAVNNATPVPVRLTSSVQLGEIPLVLIVLACFVVGIVFGLAAMAPRVFRLRRQLAQLRRQVPGVPAPQELAAERLGDRLASAARNVGAVGELDADTRAPR